MLEEHLRDMGPSRLPGIRILAAWQPLLPPLTRISTIVLSERRPSAIMVFNKDACNNDKDQLRSLKSRVQRRLGSTLKPRRDTQYTAAITPSAPQSECSTLVNFITEDVFANEECELETADGPCLDEEDLAWGMGKHPTLAGQKRLASHKCCVFIHTDVLSEDQMIDQDNRAWVNSLTTADALAKPKTWFSSMSNRSSKVSGRTGVQPELLDPEDRAWN